MFWSGEAVDRHESGRVNQHRDLTVARAAQDSDISAPYVCDEVSGCRLNCVRIRHGCFGRAGVAKRRLRKCDPDYAALIVWKITGCFAVTPQGRNR